MNIIIGHKNPDTDTVLSSIIWSKIRTNYKPKILGKLSKETEYILKEIGIEKPQFQKSVFPIMKDNINKNYPYLFDTVNIKTAIDVMNKNEIVEIPIIDNNKKFLGYLDYFDVAKLLLRDLDKMEILNKNVIDFVKKGKIVNISDNIPSKTEIENDYLRYVVNNKEFIGVITETEVLNPKRYNVILVDHNEFSQSIDGIEEANIVEIIDHHKFSFKSNLPLNIIAKPYGSTCTIMYDYIKDKKIDIDMKTKKMLLYGILTDTLGFRLSTTTEVDKEFVNELSEELGLDYREVHDNILRVATDISDMTINNILFDDYKEFFADTLKIGVGVITIYEEEQIKEKINDILKTMREEKNNRNLDSFFMVISRIKTNDSLILGVSPKLEELGKHFKRVIHNNGFIVDGIISRKKDLVPVIMKLYG